MGPPLQDSSRTHNPVVSLSFLYGPGRFVLDGDSVKGLPSDSKMYLMVNHSVVHNFPTENLKHGTHRTLPLSTQFSFLLFFL